MKRWEIDLQRFSEAGGAEAAAGATAAGTGGGADGAAGTGASGTDAASQRAESGAKVLYGIQPGAAQGTADAAQAGNQIPGSGTAEGAVAETPAPPVNREAEWQKLINGEYREQFQKQVQGIIDKRFAKTKGLEEQNGKYAALMGKVAGRYGLDPGDIDGISAAIDQDQKFLAEQADKAGMTIEQYKKYNAAVQENEQYRRMNEARQREAQVQARIQGWQAEEKALKGVYPQFDLDAELRNKDFVGLLQRGVTMKHAYEVIHMDDMMRGAMQYATAQAQAVTARNIQARGARPMEGAATGAAGVVTKSDVTKLTKADREEIARQVARGKTITFG